MTQRQLMLTFRYLFIKSIKNKLRALRMKAGAKRQTFLIYFDCMESKMPSLGIILYMYFLIEINFEIYHSIMASLGNNIIMVDTI